MNFRVIFHALLVPFACLGLLATPVHASNPLKSLGSGLKRVSGNLNPFKRLKAAPVEKPAAKPAAKPVARTPASKPAGSVKKTPGTKLLQSPALATASKPKTKPTPQSKPKAKPAKTAAAAATTMAAAGAAGAAGPEKPADLAKEDTPDETEAGSTAASNPPDATPAKPPADLPFATPVMGRKGHVRSPFAEDQGMVDVSDIPAGTKARCPYSGKVFRVP